MSNLTKKKCHFFDLTIKNLFSNFYLQDKIDCQLNFPQNQRSTLWKYYFRKNMKKKTEKIKFSEILRKSFRCQ